METFDVRDLLLLVFAELGSYGIATAAAAADDEAGVRADLTRSLREQAPYGLGSYVFWLGADEHLLAGGGMPPLFTSGAEVDVALAAALAHQGLAHQGLAEPRPDGSARPEHAHPADVVDLT